MFNSGMWGGEGSRSCTGDEHEATRLYPGITQEGSTQVDAPCPAGPTTDVKVVTEQKDGLAVAI